MVATPSAFTWKTNPREPLQEAILARELGIPPLVAAVLVSRQITDLEEADRFLNPSLDHFHDPRLLPDYDQAVACILGARDRGERIFVHGDYDVDGVTSTAIFTRFLKKLGFDVVPHVPHREKEGYGIHPIAVQAAKDCGAKLFLTCDCGGSAHEQINQARALGMAVVVTDHHHMCGKLPNAQAVVNPHRPDSRYPFKDLCGAGVVFKLCEGLCREMDVSVDNFRRAFLDLAVLGTVADVVPLIGENRIIAKFGLQRLDETKKAGLRSLLEVSNEGKEACKVTTRMISFQIGPRLNAAGRVNDAALSLDLLLDDDPASASLLAHEIDAFNRDRRAEQDRIVQEAIALVEEKGLDKENVIVISGADWHPGVVGIVANKIVDRFRRPTFVLVENKELCEARGSARSIPGFHLAELLADHGDHILKGGGHAMAAGMTIRLDKIDEVSRLFNAYAASILTEEHFLRICPIDCEINTEEADLQAAAVLQKMEPFGTGNPEPALLMRDVEFFSFKPTKNPEVRQVTFKKTDGQLVEGVGFYLGQRFLDCEAGCRGDLVFNLVVNEYQGTRKPKWCVVDFTLN